jgi:hypothetical protein
MSKKPPNLSVWRLLFWSLSAKKIASTAFIHLLKIVSKNFNSNLFVYLETCKYIICFTKCFKSCTVDTTVKVHLQPILKNSMLTKTQ